jgi:NAD+ kinase
MFKYNFVLNNYDETIDAVEKLDALLQNRQQKWEFSEEPEYLFLLGGDGTFLKGLKVYETKIASIKFIPFLYGGNWVLHKPQYGQRFRLYFRCHWK